MYKIGEVVAVEKGAVASWPSQINIGVIVNEMHPYYLVEANFVDQTRRITLLQRFLGKLRRVPVPASRTIGSLVYWENDSRIFYGQIIGIEHSANWLKSIPAFRGDQGTPEIHTIRPCEKLFNFDLSNPIFTLGVSEEAEPTPFLFKAQWLRRSSDSNRVYLVIGYQDGFPVILMGTPRTVSPGHDWQCSKTPTGPWTTF